MDPNHPVPGNGTIVIEVDNNAGAECIPGIWSPGVPPGRIISPSIRRDIRAVLPVKNVLHGPPIINIHVVTIIGIIAASAIGIALDRLYVYFFAVKIFISHYLKDGFPPAQDLDFDDGHILYIIPVYQCL
jgi:hypothetical protein